MLVSRRFSSQFRYVMVNNAKLLEWGPGVENGGREGGNVI